MTIDKHPRIEYESHQVGLDEFHEELDTTPVHAAARDGQVEVLREILCIDATQAMALDKYGLTPLHWACDRGEAAATRLLLQFGADVNVVEKRMFKRRPLHFAVLASSKATVCELLTHRADFMALDSRGWAPIHGAAYSGDVGSLQALLDAGAPIMMQVTRQHETALHVAASQGRMEAVKLLLKCCLDSEVDEEVLARKNDEGLTAAQVAARKGYEDVACILENQRGRELDNRDVGIES